MKTRFVSLARWLLEPLVPKCNLGTRSGLALALLALLFASLPIQRSLALPGTPRADAGSQTDAPLTCPPNCGTAYTVDSTGDGAHVGPLTQCSDSTGHCTLRAAIQAANANPTDDGIFFNIPTTDPGYSNGVWTINLGTALPDLSTNINIGGPGAAMLTVQRSSTAAAEFRVFNITGTSTVTLSDLTIRNGSESSSQGAGIQNTGTLSVNNCTLSGNSAAKGAGLYNEGTLAVSNSTFSGNTATGISGGQDSHGGAIYNTGPGTLTLTNCTLSGNSVTGGPNPLGGSGGTGRGGAIYNAESNAVVTNCTIAGNTANGGAGTPAGQAFGGGIFSQGTHIQSTIVANNTVTSTSPSNPDVSGLFISQGFNLIGKRDGSINFTAATDQTGTIASPLDPMLASLQNNGGPTQTIALLPGSPAIDKGTSGGLTNDQRGAGFPRTVDDPGTPNASGGSGTDIGAFELQTVTPTVLGNISTRLLVGTGDNVLIGGFIVTGTQPKKVIVRAIGPSLTPLGIAAALADPILELHGPGTFTTITNDNWRSDQEAEIIATTIPPANDLESAIVATLPANNSAYTAVVRGANDGTGVGLVEVYDLDRTVDSKLANISTRGEVLTGDNVMIAGMIVLGGGTQRVIIRAIGPSLPFAGKLADPTLELRDANGALIRSNDNWRTDQEAEIIATGIPPANDLESALIAILPAGGVPYTATVRGVNGTTGVALVEIYAIGQP
jgi:CSLREA domain-containing protein